MTYQEPKFMQELHKQREKSAKILWGRFKGDLKAYYNWQKKMLEERLEDNGYIFQKVNGGGKLVQV